MRDVTRVTQGWLTPNAVQGSLVLSFSSSSFEDKEDNVVGDGVRPYMYEPYIDSDVESVDEVENDVSVSDPQELEEEDRLTSRNWCQCSNCEVMPTVQECRCCCEIPQMRALMELVGCSCITLHPGFEPACLNQYTLDIAYSWFNQQYRVQFETNEKYRYTAYRQLVWWAWNYLRRTIRVVVPSCAVKAIRARYPSESDAYTGFKDAVESDC